MLLCEACLLLENPRQGRWPAPGVRERAGCGLAGCVQEGPTDVSHLGRCDLAIAGHVAWALYPAPCVSQALRGHQSWRRAGVLMWAGTWPLSSPQGPVGNQAPGLPICLRSLASEDLTGPQSLAYSAEWGAALLNSGWAPARELWQWVL